MAIDAGCAGQFEDVAQAHVDGMQYPTWLDVYTDISYFMK
jgi:hypothetical protein